MQTLSFLGCGRAGQVLGYLWRAAGVFRIGQILTRSASSARLARQHMGGGTALDSPAGLGPADLYLVATPDQYILEVATHLYDRDVPVFHLGGGLSSDVLREAGIRGPVASIHPAHSFGDFTHSIRNFQGTWCACEGDAAALRLLQPAFQAIGGRTFPIDTDRKLVYHAAGVMISNCLNALVATGLEAYDLAGLDHRTASSLVATVLPGIVENIITHGPAETLTGPIARGDWDLVAKELEALHHLNPELGEVYRLLGVRTLKLARSRMSTDPDAGGKLETILRADSRSDATGR